MRYPLFEFLALTVGSASIVGAALVSLWTGSMTSEVVAQGMTLVVLVGAVHWGKRGGAVTAVLAISAYLTMRLPMILREGLTPDLVALVLVRTFTYAAVGFGGGALCSRIHYVLAHIASQSNIDAASGVFNERFVRRVLASLVAQYERYHKPFSVVVLSMGAGTRAPQSLRSLRAVGDHLRDHVRLIDDVARLDDGRFLLVLPQTGKNGARIAADRLGAGVRNLLGEKAGVVGVEVLDAGEDLAAIRELCGATATATANSRAAAA